jgi:pilus assembly protein CpaB
VRTLLQNIEVLSAGTDIKQESDGKPNKVQVVNLLVTPEQAETLSLAINQAHIQLVLRNPLDTETAQMPGTAMNRLFGEVKPVPAPTRKQAGPTSARKPALDKYTIEVFNGSKKSDEKVDASEDKQ